ncbi:hypothetical protein JOD45_003252 [Scopulibacillus daqui]|uniref:Uncharacterized protein n=1 Tax=Scopulibacillus daqui TaxID=1469162 RepID=A0ABS2Q679_9BACL|nr:hypothetical protein [Scopulibacillus daqui]MBM7647017.1 hypothetical protein [Scopulibacillus daqui]
MDLMTNIIKKVENTYGIQITCDPNQKSIFKGYDAQLKKEVIVSLECLIDNDLKDPIYLLWYLEQNAVDSAAILLDEQRLQKVKFVKQINLKPANTKKCILCEGHFKLP